jgi:hypothetical protein
MDKRFLPSFGFKNPWCSTKIKISMTVNQPIFYILRMESAIMQYLYSLEKGECAYKSSISKATEIPVDILTVLLKRLKESGHVELMCVWSEEEYKPNGSGYCITESGKKNYGL